jgi:hypothetical protein
MGLKALTCPGCGAEVKSAGNDHYECCKCGKLSRITDPTSTKVSDEGIIPSLFIPLDPFLKDSNSVIEVFKNWLFTSENLPTDLQENLKIESCQLVYTPFVCNKEEKQDIEGWLDFFHLDDKKFGKDFPFKCTKLSTPNSTFFSIRKQLSLIPEDSASKLIPFNEEKLFEHESSIKDKKNLIKGYMPYFVIHYSYKNEEFTYTLRGIEKDHFSDGTRPFPPRNLLQTLSQEETSKEKFDTEKLIKSLITIGLISYYLWKWLS